ncbi:MAG: twin-arginine translocation signal domain-containing protein [Marinilabiliales bacterium]|nr:MAG: twin-arginine translocation signal domain-containing protein [Marinilabiliales bacterium]
MDQKKSLSRRKFLGDAAAIGAIGVLGVGAAASSCSRRPTYVAPVFPDQAPDGRVLKAGVIGCGGRGTGAAMNFLNSGPNLEIAALGDVFQHRLDRCRNELKEKRGVDVPDDRCFTGFDAYRRVIDTDVDVVLLCEPPYFRPKSFEYAVQNRKHIFAEKPVGVDPVGIRQVMAAGRMAESAGLNVVTGTQRRHQRDYVKTFEMVKNGAIGDLVSANCYWNQSALWFVRRQEGWTDMEAMLRDWVNWCWLSGDHIVEQHVHNIDVVNWFFEKHPVKGVGFGGRHRRPTGDQYDFFSIDFTFDDNRHMHSMCRQINGCANNVSEIIFGTKGYTNAQNTIWDYDGNVIWGYQYPLGDDGQPTGTVAVSPYDQEIINLVTAIRTGNYINETQNVSEACMTALMGRVSAYTGREVTWEEMMNSSMNLGPESLEMGTVDIPAVPPTPGTAAG